MNVSECFCLYKARAIPKETIGIIEKQKIRGPGSLRKVVSSVWILLSGKGGSYHYAFITIIAAYLAGMVTLFIIHPIKK